MSRPRGIDISSAGRRCGHNRHGNPVPEDEEPKKSEWPVPRIELHDPDPKGRVSAKCVAVLPRDKRESVHAQSKSQSAMTILISSRISAVNLKFPSVLRQVGSGNFKFKAATSVAVQKSASEVTAIPCELRNRNSRA